MPSATSPFVCWKSLTTFSVLGPKTPSMSSGPSSLFRVKTRCRRRTSSPVSPSLMVAGISILLGLASGKVSEVLLDELPPGHRTDDGVGGEARGGLEGD